MTETSDRVEELEARVEQLEAKLDERESDSESDSTGVSRRTALSGLAGLAGLGAAGGGLFATSASAATASGFVKTGELRDGNGNTQVTLNNGGPTSFSTQIDAPSVSTDKLDTSSGYEWQDVTASRSFGTWYDAPNDRDIYIQVSAQANSNGVEISIPVDVDTTRAGTIVMNPRNTVDTNSEVETGMIKVPAGHNYRIRNFGDTGSYSLKRWVELR